MVDYLRKDTGEYRMRIQQQLLEMAQNILAIKHEIPIVYEEAMKDFYVHQRIEGESPLTVLEIRADGIQPSKFIQLFQHYEDNMPKFTLDVKINKLPKEQHFRFVH